LDRGFQIVLTAYPEVTRRLDVGALELQCFEPAARVWVDGRFRHVGDPRRRPGAMASTIVAPVGTLADKVRLLRLVADVCLHPVPQLLRRPDLTTDQRLRSLGFSSQMIETFWRPLFAGIQLDPELEASSRRFETILRMLATGGSAVPRLGMGAIPEQLAAALPAGCVRLSTPVAGVRSGAVVLDGGAEVTARAVVVATDGPTAHRMIGETVPDPGSRSAACCWFSASAPPVEGTVLLLDGEHSGEQGALHYDRAAVGGFDRPLQPRVTGQAHLGARTEETVALDRFDAPEVENVADAQVGRVAPTAPHARAPGEQVDPTAERPQPRADEPALFTAEGAHLPIDPSRRRRGSHSLPVDEHRRAGPIRVGRHRVGRRAAV